MDAGLRSLTMSDGMWIEWLTSRSTEARAGLFFRYAEWSRIVASATMLQKPHPVAEWRDYVQLASIALLKAIDRFDPGVQDSFKAYAEPLIVGEILRGLECFRKDRQLLASRMQEYGLTADSDGGDYYDLEEIAEVAIGLAFGAFLEVGITGGEADMNPLSIYETHQEGDMLMRKVDDLPERERQVIAAHYFQHLPFSTIADMLSVSRPRITQLHQKALQRLRAAYENDAAMQQLLL